MAEDESTPENGEMDAPKRFARGKKRRKRSNSQSGESGSRKDQRRRSRRASRREAEDAEPKPRQGMIWLKQNWFVITFLILVFLFGLFLRSYYYYTPATENGYILSGNDPYYHKRVVDYVQDNHEHLIYDPLLSYPDGALNPRPPLYDWSVAITGLILSPFAGGDVYVSTWIVMLFAPAFWGALTVFPTYLIGKEMFNKKAGLICAFLVATMPSHVERSPLGFSDHDAIVLFFVVLSFFFFIRALNTLKVRDRWVENWFKPREIPKGFKEWFVHNQVSVAFAVMAGLSLATIALIWKGFLYPVVIIIIYFFIQMVLNKLRNKDSLGVAMVTIISLAIITFIPIPYYYGNNMKYVIEPAMEILLAVIIVSAILVPTRDSPWILVFTVLGVVLLSGYLLLMYVFPEIGSTYFSGQGYFAKNKVFSTIAEAQAPDYSRAMFSYGVVTTFLALFAIVLSIWRVAKDIKAHYLFLTIWAVTAVYMAISATRFIFNAGPIFAIMSGWMVYAIIVKLDFRKMVKHYRSLRGGGRFYAMKKSVKLRHVVGVLFLVFMIILPNVWLGWDAGVPYGEKKEVDVMVYDAIPGKIHVVNEDWGIDFWIDPHLKPDEYNSDESSNRTRYPKGTNIMYNRTDPNKLKYFGAFGHGFPSDYWLDGMRWLSEQDTELPIEERPGFISWWDYGFWAIYLGEHPTAADNFQGRVQYAGSFISAKNESEGIALLITRLLEGDIAKNQREHDRTRLHDEVYQILETRLGEENARKVREVLYNPTKYKDEVLDNPDRYGYYSDDLVPNITPIYAILETWLPEMLSDDEMTWLYHDLQEETEWSLRYFAIDSRLFPFGAQNTGIFYAPLKLSDHRISEDNEPYDYLRTLVNVGGEWITLEELEERREADSSIAPTDYKLVYYEPFMDCMLLNCYIGYTLDDIGASDPGQGNVEPNLPAVHETNYIPMQGWMMKHFRLVYRTAYWNPYNQTLYKYYPDEWVAMADTEASDRVEALESDGVDNDGNGLVDDRGEGGVVTSGIKSGVVFLKYYEGAYVSGNVTSSKGAPMPNVRVTVHDEYSVPHDTVLTDENGHYSLIVPPGNVTLQLSIGGFGDDQYAPYRVLTQNEKTALNNTYINVSDDAAMRREVDEDGDGIWDYYITRDFQVEGNSLAGKLFWDSNADGNPNPEEGNISNARIVIYNRDLDVEFERTTDESGDYEFDDVMPGEYNISYEISGHPFDLSDTLTFSTATNQVKVIGLNPAALNGVLYSTDAGFLTDKEVEIHDKINETSFILKTNSSGGFAIDPMLSGNYSISVEIGGYELVEVDVDLDQGDDETLNITLASSTDVVGVITNDVTGEILANVTVKFEGLEELSGISRIATSNETGFYEIDVKNGRYTVSAKHDIGEENPYRHVGKIEASGGKITYNITLSPGIEVRGTSYFDYNNNGSADPQDIKPHVRAFFTTQAGTLTAVTNSMGFYRIFLPEGNYSVHARMDSPVTDATFSILEELSVLGPGPVDYDIVLDRGQVVNGYVHYDRNGDEFYEEHEALDGVRMTFTDAYGLTIEALTDGAGRYSINLPQNETFNITAEHPGFETLTITDLTIDGLSSQNVLRMIPEAIDLTGLTQHMGSNISNVDITFVPVEGMGGENATASSNGTGAYQADILPGEYRIFVYQIKTEAGKLVNYTYNAGLHLDVGQGTENRDLELTRFVMINGTVQGTSGNVTITFEPADDPSKTSVTIDSLNSYFEEWIEPGEYSVYFDETAGAVHNVFLALYSFTGSQTLTLSAEQGTEVNVLIEHKNIQLPDLEVSFTSNGTSMGLTGTNGQFRIFLPSNRTYDVAINSTRHEVADTVLYTYAGVLEVLNVTIDFEPPLTRYILVPGTVFIDYDEDGDPGAQEGMSNITVRFESPTHNVTVITNETGGYQAFLLDETEYSITFIADFAFIDENLTLVVEEDLDDDERNQKLKPSDLTVSGQVTINGTAAPHTGLWFWAESESAVNSSVVSDASGNFALDLPLGEYTLYAKKVAGQNVYVYLGAFSPKPRETLNRVLNLTEAFKVRGYIYHINSTGQNLSAAAGVEFGGEGIMRTTSQANGLFEMWLPASEYAVTASLDTFEYNLSMDYDYKGAIELSDDIEMSIELKKDKKYDVKLEWIEGVAANLTQNDTVVYHMRVTNTGNEKEEFALQRSGVPSWNITLAENITLDIGETAEFPVTITTAPDATVEHGKIEITASSFIDVNAKDTVEITVNINQSLSAAEIHIDEGVIVAENNTLKYAVIVMNPGNDVENFTLSLSNIPADWNATLEETEIRLDAYDAKSVPITFNISYDTSVRSTQVTVNAISASGAESDYIMNVSLANLDIVDDELEVTGELVTQEPVDTSTIPGFEAIALIGALLGIAFVMKRRRWP